MEILPWCRNKYSLCIKSIFFLSQQISINNWISHHLLPSHPSSNTESTLQQQNSPQKSQSIQFCTLHFSSFHICINHDLFISSIHAVMRIQARIQAHIFTPNSITTHTPPTLNQDQMRYCASLKRPALSKADIHYWWETKWTLHITSAASIEDGMESNALSNLHFVCVKQKISKHFSLKFVVSVWDL